MILYPDGSEGRTKPPVDVVVGWGLLRLFRGLTGRRGEGGAVSPAVQDGGGGQVREPEGERSGTCPPDVSGLDYSWSVASAIAGDSGWLEPTWT